MGGQGFASDVSSPDRSCDCARRANSFRGLEQYALTEAGFTIARILQCYEGIEAVHPDEEPKIEAALTISPQQCLVRLIPLSK